MDGGEEILGMSANASEDVEQSREQAAAALAGLKKNQKDEKKAKKHDHFLVNIITEILQKHEYDHIIWQLVPLLESRCSSNLLVSILMLLECRFIDYARTYCQLEPIQEPKYTTPSETIEYDGNMDPALRNKINIWFETFKKVLTTNQSEEESKRSRDVFAQNKQWQLIDLGSHVFGHFLYEHGVRITSKKAKSYSEFIVNEMRNILLSS